ncbi:MAG: thiamine biosynthesis protein ThiS [Candidatus Omnitrophota bacterium]|jgi:thiamine biosynthesis protein ThiS
MRLTINGQVEDIAAETLGLVTYLSEKKINPQTVAIELNHEVISKSVYATTLIKEGDVIEIVRFVGGGC